jgi:hypothetical protein
LRPKRRHERYTRRLEVEFSAHDKTYVGISSNLSMSGMFIRSNHPFPPETIVSMTIHLPDGKFARVKGRVKTALRTAVTGIKNGMGIEFIERDPNYLDFITSFEGPDPTGQSPRPGRAEERPGQPGAGPSAADFLIVACPQCGVKNKVAKAKISWGVKCGKCRSPIEMGV